MKLKPVEYNQNMWVTFNDLDPYGHLPTHRYMKLVLSSRWIFAKQYFNIEPQDITNNGLGFFITNIKSNFLHPIHKQTEVLCRSRVAETAGATLYLTFEIVSVDESVVYFSGTCECKCIDLKTNRPCVLPDFAKNYFFEENDDLQTWHAKRHYDTTALVYPHLTIPKTQYMNFGYWPADTLTKAQEQLTNETLKLIPNFEYDLEELSVVELGCGYGALTSILKEKYPLLKYTGVNFDNKQIAEAKKYNDGSDYISYVESSIEDFALKNRKKFDLALSIEAFHHVESKNSVINNLGSDISTFVLAEICIERHGIFSNHPHLKDPLHSCWSTSQYLESFRNNGFKNITITDVTEDTVFGMCSYIESLPANFLDHAFESVESQKIMHRLKQSFKDIGAAAKRRQLSYNIIVAQK